MEIAVHKHGRSAAEECGAVRRFVTRVGMTLIGVNPRTLQQPAPFAGRWWAGASAPEQVEPRREAYKRTPNLRAHQLDFLDVLGTARSAFSLAQSARRALTDSATYSLRVPTSEPVAALTASRGAMRAAGVRDVARWLLFENW